MVTLKDVAKAVGVSPKTVSRVVNDDPAVHAETRELVRAAVARLNYVPDQAARMMRLSASEIVGLMTDRVATTPYSVDLVRGAGAELKARGFTLLIASTDGDAAAERAYWQLFRSQKAAGVIYATVYHRPVDLAQNGFERPLVLANCYAIRRDLPAVVPDDEGGGYAQARHVIENGHRRIGIVSLNPTLRATALRGAGHRSAFAEAGVAFDPALERPGFLGTVEAEQLVAFETARELLDRPDRPTAILCGNDRIAMQVFAAAASLGLAVPEDISVVGFDDMTVISQTLRPALTTVALPYFEIGRLAAACVVAGEAGEGVGTGRTTVPCPLVVRQSCRALA